MSALFAAEQSGDLFAILFSWLTSPFFYVPLLLAFAAWLTNRYIPNDQVGIVEKLWSGEGSVGDGKIIALNGEAGYQAEILRGGIHFGIWRWQYAVHRVALVTIPQGKIGYVYARDGQALPPTQTLAQVVDSNDFQDARRFLMGAMVNVAGHDQPVHLRGQRGRQRAILREGVYAINLALFVVIARHKTYSLSQANDPAERANIQTWQQQMAEIGGFEPVVIGGESVPMPNREEFEQISTHRHHRHRDRSRRPVAIARRNHRTDRRFGSK